MIQKLSEGVVVAVDVCGEVGVAREENWWYEGVDHEGARRFDHVVMDEAELFGDEDRRQEVFRGEADGRELFELEDEGNCEDDVEERKDDRCRGVDLHIATNLCNSKYVWVYNSSQYM